jgi:tetratricopeptide (TPR) repeat protein
LERNDAFKALANKSMDPKQRDDICSVALAELSFILQYEPANSTIWKGQGEIYVIMERYKEAIESFYKAYNARQLIDDVYAGIVHMLATEPGVIFGGGCDETLKGLMATEPSTDFDIDSIDDAFLDQSGIHFCVILGDAFIKNGDYEIADKLLARADKKVKSRRNTNEWWKYRHLDCKISVARSECCLGLKKYDMAARLAEEAFSRRRYQPGIFKILAQCEKARGNISKAVSLLGVGYFYEEPWNEKTRSDNLKRWKDLQKTMRESFSQREL